MLYFVQAVTLLAVVPIYPFGVTVLVLLVY